MPVLHRRARGSLGLGAEVEEGGGEEDAGTDDC